MSVGRPPRRVWTPERIRALGVVTSVATAASVLGIGRTLAYELVAAEAFPVAVIRAGKRVIVPVQPILQLLRLDPDTNQPAPPGPTGVGRLDDPARSSVDSPTRPADSPPPPQAVDLEHHGGNT